MTTKNNTYLKGLFIMSEEKCKHEWFARETRYNEEANEIYRRYECGKCSEKFYTVEFEITGEHGVQKCDDCNKRYSVQKLGGYVPGGEVMKQKRCLKCGKTIQTVEFVVIFNKLFKKNWSKSWYRPGLRK